MPDRSSRSSRALTSLLDSRYCGYMGVDMMVVRRGDGFALVPCVELNLRMTMGVVAMKVAERLGMVEPHRLAWSHNAPAAGRILLPSAEGFTLSLSKL